MKKILIILLILVAAGGAVAYGLNTKKKADQAKTAVNVEVAEKKFLQDMVAHHEASISIASTANEQAEAAEIQTMAAILAATQSREITDMKAWYKQWFGAEVPPVTTDPHAGHAAEPTGENAPKTFDEGYMTQMIPHHELGINMAKDVLAQTQRQELKELADSIISLLSSQVEQMKGYQREGFKEVKPHCDSVASC